MGVTRMVNNRSSPESARAAMTAGIAQAIPPTRLLVLRPPETETLEKPVSDIAESSHRAAVLEQGGEPKENQDLGQKNEDPRQTRKDAIDQQTSPPRVDRLDGIDARGHPSVQQICGHRRPAVDGLEHDKKDEPKAQDPP